MATKSRYILPEENFGNVYHSQKGPIELSANTSQADLQYLREDCGLQYIQKGQNPMTLTEEVKVMKADLAVLEDKLEKQKKKAK